MRPDAFTKEIEFSFLLVGGHGEDGGPGVGDARDYEGVGGVLSSGSALKKVEQNASTTESPEDRGWKVSLCVTQ